MRKWQQFFLGATVGLIVGITVSLVALGGWRLLSARNSTPNAWNAKAIRASEPPSVEVEGPDNHLVLRCRLINSTSENYELASYSQIKTVMTELDDGSLAGPWDNTDCQFHFPIFIPPTRRTH